MLRRYARVSASTYSKIRNSLSEQEDKIIVPIYKGTKETQLEFQGNFMAN